MDVTEVDVEDNQITNADIIRAHVYANRLPPNNIELLKQYRNEQETCDEEITLNYLIINWLLKRRETRAYKYIPTILKKCYTLFTKENLNMQIDNAKKLDDILLGFQRNDNNLTVFRGFKEGAFPLKRDGTPKDLITLHSFVSTSLFKDTAKRFGSSTPHRIMVINIPAGNPIPFISPDTDFKKNVERNAVTSEAEVLLPIGTMLKYKSMRQEVDTIYYFFDLLGVQIKPRSYWTRLKQIVDEVMPAIKIAQKIYKNEHENESNENESNENESNENESNDNSLPNNVNASPHRMNVDIATANRTYNVSRTIKHAIKHRHNTVKAQFKSINNELRTKKTTRRK
jgi:hypothetical protein